MSRITARAADRDGTDGNEENPLHPLPHAYATEATDRCITAGSRTRERSTARGLPSPGPAGTVVAAQTRISHASPEPP